MSDADLITDIRITESPRELRRLAADLDAFAERHALPSRVTDTLALAIEEVVTNVLSYAFDDLGSGPHQIHVRLVRDPGVVRATIIDDGRAFDPTAVPIDREFESLDEVELGGWGIRLVRKLMDEVRYRRYDGHNHLELVLSTGETI